MKVSAKGRYALVFMINLAKNYENDTYLSINDIAKKENLSYKYLEKVVAILSKKDYFYVNKGKEGGYKLKYEPKDYVIGDILRTSEGTLAPISCVENTMCTKKINCTAYSFWDGLYKEINNYIDSKTLEDYI